MTPEENERLCLVGPGTPGGEMRRRYWFPVAISEELTDLPKLVRFLGEDLVLFRDGRGRPGLLGKNCSHRGTSLEFGQIEEDGMRCCYHGWLYNVEGRVLDTPAEPPESDLKRRVKHLAYPCREVGGFVFTYMGPPEKMPELPVYDFLVREDGARELWTEPRSCNWLQRVENHVDSAHTALLHQIPSKWMFGHHREGIPDSREERTDYGVAWTEIRPTSRRQACIVLPSLALMPEVSESRAMQVEADPKALSRLPEEEPYTVAMWTVPVDDTHLVDFRLQFLPHNNGKARSAYGSPGRTAHKTYEESQRAPADKEAQEGQGPISRRDEWNLGKQDEGVVLYQQVIADAIDAVEGGEDPPGIIRDPAQARLIDTRELIRTTYEVTPLESWRLEKREVWSKRLGPVIR